jgi:hypothetical protein
MQTSEAREIVKTPELTENWKQLTEAEADILMDHVQSQQDRQECCFPYDCMHHEACAEGYPCGSCKRGAERWAVVNKVLEKFPLGYQYATALNSTIQTMMDQSMKYALSNADAQTKIELQNIDASTRQALAATEATYKNQMQASASANEVFQQVSKNIADIMANPDLSADAKDAAGTPPVTPKQAAVDMQKNYLKNSLAILSATSGINGLKTLLDFT